MNEWTDTQKLFQAKLYPTFCQNYFLEQRSTFLYLTTKPYDSTPNSLSFYAINLLIMAYFTFI